MMRYFGPATLSAPSEERAAIATVAVIRSSRPLLLVAGMTLTPLSFTPFFVRGAHEATTSVPRSGGCGPVTTLDGLAVGLALLIGSIALAGRSIASSFD